MKLSLLLFFCVFITINLCAQGVTKYGQSTTTSTVFVDKNGKIGSVARLNKNGKILNSCGSTLTITHSIGIVAPLSLTINYGTVTTSLSGASKCWITQNLGASTQASSAADNTDASAGWYWQFNRRQGYINATTPTWTITSIDETYDWLAGRDPCTIELGAGWRIPTQTEWTNADAAPQNWASYTDTYNSVLKLHAAGRLYYSNGALFDRGTSGGGHYWSSTQGNSINGWTLNFYSGSSYIDYDPKASGNSLRCLRD